MSKAFRRRRRRRGAPPVEKLLVILPSRVSVGSTALTQQKEAETRPLMAALTDGGYGRDPSPGRPFDK